MEILGAIGDYLKANWVNIVAVVILIEKGLRILDRLLPASVTVDNDIADIIAKIIKTIAPQKKTV